MKYSKLSEYKIKKVLRCFADELTASQAAKQVELNRHTCNRLYQVFREDIALYLQLEIDADPLAASSGNSLFKQFLLKSKSRAKQTEGSIVEVVKTRNCICTKIISTTYTYVQECNVKSQSGIGVIESFWSCFKRKIRKHNGIRGDKVYWYLKEAEFRFNFRHKNIYEELLKIVKM